MATYNFDYALQMLRQAIDFAEAEKDYTPARKWASELALAHKADMDERDELREQLEIVSKAEPLSEESETLDWLQPDELIKVEVDSVGVEVCPRCHQSVYGHPFGLPCGTYSASDITRGGTLKFPQGLTFAAPDTKVTVKMERKV